MTKKKTRATLLDVLGPDHESVRSLYAEMRNFELLRRSPGEVERRARRKSERHVSRELCDGAPLPVALRHGHQHYGLRGGRLSFADWLARR